MPFRLAPFFSPRPWGSTNWVHWYPEARFTEPIGESWLTGPQSLIETGPWTGLTLAQAFAAHRAAICGPVSRDADFPLLLKILAPTEKLSLQVHPDDAAAQQSGFPRGKTECWYILDSQPGAALSLGLTPGTTPEQVRRAIAEGTLDERMNILPVAPGEMFFVDAGTIHGIGPGMTILETQQTCDITYRVFDYGRGRELHIPDALRVMRLSTRAGRIAPCDAGSFSRLIHEQYFTVDRFDLDAAASVPLPSMKSAQILVALADGASLVCAGQSLPLTRGHAVIVPALGPAATLLAQAATEVLRAFPG